MAEWIVTRKSDGVEVFRYGHDVAVEWKGMEFATHTHTEFVPPPPPPTAVPSVRIHKLAFRQRFTAEERVTIEIAAIDVPDAPMEQRAASAALRSYQEDIAAASYIDLTDPDTIAGVTALETSGLLAPARAAAILTAPPTEDEVWNG